MAATLCCCHFFCFSQNRNSVWCFGDSALIDFSDTSNIIVGSCGLDTRGSCASIANENGKLLFYAETRATISGNTTLVFDTTHQVMQNGNNIVGRGWYQELVIVPNAANDSTYYLFSIGVTSIYGLYYSIIDMRLNNGLGAVTVKNVQLQSFEQVDCLNAVKHGNGRDWWLLFRKAGSLSNGNNDWYSYLITPDSIQNVSVQSIGSLNKTNSGYTNLIGLVELYDFDRCSGLLSNPVTIEPEALPSVPYTWSCEFSPDASKLYVTTADDTTYLFQYDLNASNISQSKNTLWTTNYPLYTGGGLKLAPDNKIYLASIYYNGVQFPYPYQDTVYNMYNMNLSVINQPDSLGSACDFQPYSFYLGGKRTYVGLPNNPDYELGALTGSICDTLTSVKEITEQNVINIFPNPFFNKIAFQYQQHSSTKIKEATIFNSTGEIVFEKKVAQTLYELDLSFLPNGVYFLTIHTEKSTITKKLVKL
ncbi:MAG: T9SS type A sorting domain-containing protein [Bacteroidetes bacterium]|nr:T9SS type A sorting domain-containing protein [Bacteroidota bacterium]